MHTLAPLWLWSVFIVFVLLALFVDFVVLKKQGAHEVTVPEAIRWSAIWVALSFAFNGLLWWAFAQEQGTAVANTKALEFLTGYLIEKSLAVDNIFVFLMIFTYFSVPVAYQKRVLMIGIIGAIVLRTVMILVGGWLISQFHWILYVFGAFLVLTGAKMWWAADQEPDLEDNPALKILRKVMPVSKHFDGEHFWTVQNGVRIATPLLLVVASGRLHRCDLCRGLDPGHLCDHVGPLHRADVQHLRHPGPACDVLPAGRHGCQVPPAELWPGGDPGVHRHEDAADRPLQDPGAGVAGGGDRHPGHHDDLEREDRAPDWREQDREPLTS
jgi:TerC family integral membrane protein